MKILSLCALLTIFAVPARAVDASEDAIKKAVLEVHVRMSKASEAGDTEKMFESIYELGPGTIIDDGVMRMTREEALDAVKRGLQSVTKVERKYNRTHITVLAPTVALLVGEGVATFVLADGRRLTSRFAVSEVFVLRDGKWSVVHGHHSVPNVR